MTPMPLWRPKPRPGTPICVLDTSVPLAWMLTFHPTSYPDDVLREASSHTTVVPVSWPLELARLARALEQTGGVSAARVDRFLRGLHTFPYLLDRQAPTRAWREILTLARAHSISIYDAVYLELALRRRLPLATVDAALAAAAAAAGVPHYSP